MEIPRAWVPANEEAKKSTIVYCCGCQYLAKISSQFLPLRQGTSQGEEGKLWCYLLYTQ